MTSSSRTRRLRVGAVGASVAVLATFGLSACGSGGTKPAQSAVEAKLKTVSEFSSLNDATLNCIAGVLEKYGTASSLNKFVSSGDPDDIKGKQSDEDNVTNDTKTCVTNNEGSGTSDSPSPSATSS